MINSEILEISNNPTLESCDAIFFEHIFPLKNKLSKLVRDSNSNSFIEITSNLNLKNQENSYLRRSKIRTEKIFGVDFFLYLVEDDLWTYDETMNSLETSFSKETINSEMNYIIR